MGWQGGGGMSQDMGREIEMFQRWVNGKHVDMWVTQCGGSKTQVEGVYLALCPFDTKIERFPYKLFSST